MKTELDSFTQGHLIQWLKWKYGNNFSEHLELIDLFLSELDADELRYWLSQGWRAITKQVKKEFGREVPIANDWRKLYPMNYNN